MAEITNILYFVFKYLLITKVMRYEYKRYYLNFINDKVTGQLSKIVRF